MDNINDIFVKKKLSERTDIVLNEYLQRSHTLGDSLTSLSLQSMTNSVLVMEIEELEDKVAALEDINAKQLETIAKYCKTLEDLVTSITLRLDSKAVTNAVRLVFGDEDEK